MAASLVALQKEVEQLEQSLKTAQENSEKAKQEAAFNGLDDDKLDAASDVMQARGFDKEAERLQQDINKKQTEIKMTEDRITKVQSEIESMEREYEHQLSAKRRQLEELTGIM